MSNSLFEQNGGTYSVASDYQIPNLTVPNESEHHIGFWGQRRLSYLKKNRHILYANLLTSGKLADHLHEIDVAASERAEIIVQQVAEAQGITERLKAENQMLWVGSMNNIRTCANEIVQNELIYC